MVLYTNSKMFIISIKWLIKFGNDFFVKIINTYFGNLKVYYKSLLQISNTKHTLMDVYNNYVGIYVYIIKLKC